jgi:hypothetical protein
MKLIYASAILFVFAIGNVSSQEVLGPPPCITCLSTNDALCQRVIVPGGAHLFYGPSKQCTDQRLD